jgi:integrase-like protein
VGELADVWLAGKINLKPTSRARYADVLKTHVLPRWGNVALIRVTHGDVQTWLSELSDRGLAGASVRKAQGVLSGILGLAVVTGVWPSTPRSAWPCPRRRRSAAGT